MTDPAPPQLSVLIATHGRLQRLPACLQALEAQTVDPAEFEVVIADDGSPDGTAAALEALETPLRLRVLRLQKMGKPRALNRALEEARGEVCLFIDDDVIASPGLVEAHLRAHREEPRTLGLGPLEQPPPRGRDWFGRSFAIAWNAHFAELQERPARWTDCYGGNFSAPREDLRAVGGFATGLGTIEDFDIAYRLRERLRPRFLAAAGAVHDDRKGRDRILADLRREARAYVEFAAAHPESGADLLDWRHGAGAAELALRRALIALRLPPRWVALPGPLLPGPGRRQVLMHFVRRLAFWSAVRAAVDDRAWEELTRR